MKEHELIETPINLRCGITIFPAQDRAIDHILNTLLEMAPARLILLTDTSGQIVSIQGERGKINPVAIGSLAAADLAASQELARISGEYQENQLIIREGTTSHTIIFEVGKYLILMVQFSSDVPLGWVRHLVRKVAVEIDKVVTAPSEEMDTVQLDLGSENMKDLIGGALDDVWIG